MAVEIERKFLIKENIWEEPEKGMVVKQGYLSLSPLNTVRVRVADNRGFLTLKGKPIALARDEFEYEIPVEDAEIILERLALKPLIEKVRFYIECYGHTWEVDKFLGDNSGLIIAEIELKNAEEKFKLPSWAGEEVTGQSKYYNANLVKNPFKEW